MANDLNQCNFIGRLGKSPETRYAPSGDAITSFSIAVGSQWKDRNGDRQESTEWVNCSVFGKLAEVCGQYLIKGSRVFISGRMKTEKWADKQGVERYTTKVIVNQMQMLDSKRDRDGGDDNGFSEQQQKPAQRQSAPATQPRSNSFEDMEDDIPFIINDLHLSYRNLLSKSYVRAKYGRGLHIARVHRAEF